MAVVFMEGFDLYNGIGANTGAQTRWVVLSGGFSFAASMVTGRFGGQALRVGSVPAYSQFRTLLPSTYTSMSLGFAYRLSALGTAAAMVWLALDGGTQVCLRVTNIGQIAAYSGDGASYIGGTLLGSPSAACIFANTWHFIEFSTAIHDSTGTVTVKVDGATVLTLTGQDTKAQSGAGVNQLWFGSSNQGSNTDFDDVYMVDSTTSLGEMRVETLRASADTADADFTPNTGLTGYTQVDDTTADGDTTYIQSTSVGDLSLFDLSNLSTTPTSIPAVQPVQFARKTDSATRTLYLTVKSASTVDDGSAINLAADYNAFRRIIAVDPADAAAWTKAKVDALKAGPTVAA